VYLEGFWDMPPGFAFNMGFTAIFERAAVVWDMSSGKPLTVFHAAGNTETPAMPPNDGYYGEIEYFLTCIEQGRKPRTSTPKDSRDAVAIALAEARSIRTGKPVATR